MKPFLIILLINLMLIKSKAIPGMNEPSACPIRLPNFNCSGIQDAPSTPPSTPTTVQKLHPSQISFILSFGDSNTAGLFMTKSPETGIFGNIWASSREQRHHSYSNGADILSLWRLISGIYNEDVLGGSRRSNGISVGQDQLGLVRFLLYLRVCGVSSVHV